MDEPTAGLDHVDARALGFERRSRRVLSDAVQRYYIFALEQPLASGDSVRMSFDLAFRPAGFSNGGADGSVARHAIYLDRLWFPVIGYQPDLELKDDDLRQELGLKPRAPQPPPHDAASRQHAFSPRDAGWVDFEAVIGTAAGHLAVTSGTLLRQWRENRRDYFHYRARAPIINLYPILSAEYEVRKDRWQDVELQVLHHPGHGINVERMLRGMKAALAYHSEHFGA